MFFIIGMQAGVVKLELENQPFKFVKMNGIKLLIICAFCVYEVFSANAQKVISLNPLFKEQDIILMPEIEGYWTMPAFDWSMSLKKAGDNFYRFIDDVETSASEFEAVFVNIKGEIFLDLRGIFPENTGNSDYRNSFLSGHNIYKIKVLDDSLSLASLNYSWFYNQAVKKKLALEFDWISNGMLLTFSTDELKSFLADHSHEDGIFDEPVTIMVENNHQFAKTAAIPNAIAHNHELSLSQRCTPTFPFKDGWLGGDGDVSVPMNDTTTIFIFSDTYVGNRNQKSRQEPGMGMVANTVATQTCLNDGETKVHYYWNEMYTDNPEPFFKSFTDRYKYWVIDAFTASNNLYVILGKVGPKFGAAPDEIFNFSGLGFTLAKISNPTEVPSAWKIEMFPLPDFKNSTLEIRCHAILDKHIYFLVSRSDTLLSLVRKQIDFIDNTEIPFEYYALNKKWKQDINPDDMFEIAKGFRCNTVSFHPEIKQWIMISDIRFMDNKIKMRTAPALTGPWSDEKVIFEIPERTPGNPLYRKSSFCYLAREHKQYYDSYNHVMLLTYDINSTDFSEILSNPEIYTPRVIQVPLNPDWK